MWVRPYHSSAQICSIVPYLTASKSQSLRAFLDLPSHTYSLALSHILPQPNWLLCNSSPLSTLWPRGFALIALSTWNTHSSPQHSPGPGLLLWVPLPATPSLTSPPLHPPPRAPSLSYFSPKLLSSSEILHILLSLLMSCLSCPLEISYMKARLFYFPFLTSFSQ